VKSALVTGGCGFQGSSLVRELMNRGREVVVMDDLSSGRLGNIENLNCGFYQADVTKIESWLHLARNYKVDEIYHLAAIVGVKRVLEDPIKCANVEIDGIRKVLDYSLRFDCRLFVSSTSSVYGRNAGICGEGQNIALGSSLVWTYASAKALSEYLVLTACRMNGLKATIGRFFNIIGVRQGLSSNHVLPSFIDKALRGEDIQIYGTGRQIRSFLYVKEAVKAVVDLMETDKSIGEIYNIGTNVSYSIIQLAEIVKETLNSKSKITYVPYREAYQVNGYDDVNFRLAETTKIKSVINFNPQKKIEDIILEIANEM
jgi:UDP-glucose 4-epimerase